MSLETDQNRKIVQISVNVGGRGVLALSDDGKVWMARGDHWEEIWPESEKLGGLAGMRPVTLKLLNECDLPTRVMNVCTELKLNTLGDLARMQEREVLRQKNAGRKTLKELRELLQRHELYFGYWGKKDT